MPKKEPASTAARKPSKKKPARKLGPQYTWSGSRIATLGKDLQLVEPGLKRRPPKPIDLDQLERLCRLHCTDEEIALYFSVSVKTIERRKKRPAFAERMDRGRAIGKLSLRRLQWQTANGYGPQHGTMQIWLGKQLLGQKDRVAQEHSGPNGAPIEVSDARSRLADLLAKRAEQRRAEPPPSETD